jgi:hypothetical protein
MQQQDASICYISTQSPDSPVHTSQLSPTFGMRITGKSPSLKLCCYSELRINEVFRLSGRYPWAIENALTKYGDIVRIAPNELVFITPQASIGE